jgi:MFS family permease
MTAAAASLGARAVLRIPDYRRLFVAQAISDVGDGLTLLTLLLVVNQLTHSTAALAIMSIAIALPPVTIGLVAGAYADRLDRRRIMLVSDSLRSVLVLGFVATATLANLPFLYVLAFVQASIGTFFSPARSALIPRVVPSEGLLAANSMSQISRVIATLVGTGLAGLILGVTGQVWPSFVIDALTFLASVAIVLGVNREIGKPDPAAADSHGTIGSSVGDGLRAIGRSRTLLATVVGLSVAMLGMGAINVLFVPFLLNVLHETPAWSGPLEGAQTLSMILAGGLVAALASRLKATTILTASLVGVALVVGLFALAPNVWVLMVLLFAAGWFVTPLQASATTLFQTSAPDAVRGRVFAAVQACMSTTTIISTAAAGVLADLMGVRVVVGLGGIVVGIGALTAWLLFSTDPQPRSVAPEGQPGRDASAAPVA